MTSLAPGYVSSQAAPWALVSGALLYGVVKTVDTAAALFSRG